MPGGFKDLSELHIASVESAQAEMFHKVIEAAMWRADREHELSSSSSNSLGVDGDDEESRSLRVERFGSLPRYTGPRPSVIRGIFPKGFPTSIYGEGGIAKSTIALHMCMSIAAAQKQWLGYPIDQPSPCLYVDFEMDREEQGTRAQRIAKGMGIEIPDDLHYLWASGFRFSDAFPLILEAVDELGVRVVAFDSLGMALEGDALKGAVVIDFFRDRIDQLKRRGVSVLIVDHQSGLRPGESYQNKAQYGSVYKGYLSRSRLQLELDERNEVGTRVIVRQNKTNFGSPQMPFVVQTLFEENKIVLSREALSEEDLREESVLNATDRVLLSLLDGPSYPADLQEKTNLAGVGNIITKLKRKELIELTGQKVGKADEVVLTDRGQGLAEVIRSRLSSSSSNTPSTSGDDEANESDGDSLPSPKPYRRSDDEEKPKKKSKKPKSPEEEEELRASLAGKFNYIYTEEDARRCLEWVKSAAEMALDIETYGKLKRDGLFYTKGRVRLISLHYDGGSWFIDCDHVASKLVVPILEEIKDKPKYLHNSLFDIPRLYRRFGVLLDSKIHDTVLASRVARAGEWEKKKFKVIQKSHGLDDCLQRELGIEIPKDRELKWGGPLMEEHLQYAVDDVAHLKELYEALKEVLREHGVEERYDAIRSRLPDFIGAAVRGVPLDISALRPALEALEEEKADLESRLNELAPEHPEGLKWVWGNTSKETSPEGKGRNGALRALSLLRVNISDLQDQTLLDHREDHELVHTLYLYRKKANTLSRYSRWIPDFYEEGRMYPQPKVAASVTGRVLYSDPNAQGIDKKIDVFRRCVKAADGRAIVKGDFAQQELRIAAYYSKDKNMVETFANGEDIYLQTAAKLVGKPVGKNHPARQAAKRATLGFLYGLGTEKYRQNVYKDTGERLTRSQANRDREAFRAAFPEFYSWQQTYGGKHEWETRSALGWRRVVSPDKDNKPKYTERLNGPIQSTAGDILYLTLKKLAADPRPGTHFLLSVHDELVLECPKEDARGVAVWLRAKMGEAMKEILGEELGGPTSAEVGYGPSWGECVELEVVFEQSKEQIP
jgi:DNA polymerase I